MASALSLANVIDSDFRLAALQTHAPDRVFEVFKRLTLTTGRAVYGWSPDDGLYRLGTERIFIPQTRSIGDALGYISASRHYGIYLLQDVVHMLEKPSIARAMERILQKDDNVKRLVILMGESVAVPSQLEGQVAVIRHAAPERAATG